MSRIVQWKQPLIALFGVVMSCASTPANADLTLVRDGQPCAVIVIPGGRDWKTQSWTVQVEEQSARCLQANILQMSGARLPILADTQLGSAKVVDGRVVVNDAAPPDVFILLGDMELVRALGVTADDLAAGGLHVRTFPNALVLFGHPTLSHPTSDGGGLRAAVVYLLETFGCRYLWPGESGKVVPGRSTIAVAPMDYTFNPPIQQRYLRWGPITKRTEEGLRAMALDVAAYRQAMAQAMQTQAGALVEPPRYQNSADFGWLQWHGTGGDVGLRGGHAFGDAWTRWGQDHPDWFALQSDGTRDQSHAGSRSRLCVSNLGLIQAVADEVAEQARQNPTHRSFSLSPNDGGYSSFCTCSACESLDAPDGPTITLLSFDKVGKPERHAVNHVALTDRYVWFWNQIAQRVAASHPHLLLVVDAYSAYATAPRREKLHPSLVLRYVPSDDGEWQRWREAGASRMYWRPNVLLRASKQGELTVYARSLAEIMQRLARDGMLAVDMDSITGSWATLGLNYYVAARMSWNPDRTYDQVLDDFCVTGFDAAAPAVRRYFDLAEACYRDYPLYETPVAELVKLRAILADADASAGANGAVRRRIAFLRMGLNYTELRQRIDQMVQAAEAQQSYDASEAGQLIDLHHLMLRELALHHPLTIDAGLVMRYGVHHREWNVLGGSKRRPDADTLSAAAAATRLTGAENSIPEMLAAFGLDGSPLPAAKIDSAADVGTVMEADEAGVVHELPQP